MFISTAGRASPRLLASACVAVCLSACVRPPVTAELDESAQGDPVVTQSISAPSPESERITAAPDPGSCQWDPRLANALTLAIAINRALCSHPRMRDAKASVDIELAQERIAKASRLPTLSGNVTHAHSETRAMSAFGQSNSDAQGTASGLTLSWLLYDFGGRAAQIAAASELVVAAVAGRDVILQNTFVSVTEAYFNVVTLTSLARIANTAILNARRLMEAADLRERMGAATAADRQYANVGRAQAELYASRVNEQLQIAKGDLATALNLDPNTDLKLKSHPSDRDIASTYFSNRTAERIGALIQTVENHPHIRAAAARATSSQAQMDAARSELWPKISMVGNYYANGRPGASVSTTRSNETYVGFSFNYPLFDGFATHHRIKLAQAQHERNLAALDDARAQVKSAIWKAHQSSIISVQSHSAAKAVVESAAAAKAQAQIRYANGAGDITEWLRAEKTYFDAQMDAIRTESDIRTARLRLMLALGDLGSWAFNNESNSGPARAKSRAHPTEPEAQTR